MILKPILIIPHIRILPPRLRHKPPRQPRPQQIAPEENPQNVRQPDLIGAAEVVEQEGGEDSADFARGGRYAVPKAADARGEDLGGDDEGGGVGAEVEEELRIAY